MRRSERRAVERLLAAAVPEGDGLPRVEETDAVEAFATWIRSAPRPNRVALRLLLLTPFRGDGATQFLTRIATHCYYGDVEVMRRLGYDAPEVAARGLALRRAEGRL
jgi:hypothetical protein